MSDAVQQSDVPARRDVRWGWCALALVLPAAFMVWGAGYYTVFDDEAFSCRRYVLPTSELVSALWRGVEPDPPLYYLIENAWVQAVGVAPRMLRLPSILFFVVGLVFLRRAGEVWFDERAGRAALWLAAVHPAHLFFGFAARWYSLMFALVAALLWLSGRLARDPGRSMRLRVAWGVVAAAVCYTNYFGPVVVVMLWWAVVRAARSFDGASRTALRPLLVALIVAVILFVPWLPPFVRQLLHFPRPPLSLMALGASAARVGVALVSGNLAGPFAWWVWAPAVVAVMAFVSLLVRAWPDIRALAVPVIVLLLVAIASRSIIDKYILTVSGPVVLLAAGLLTCGSRSGERGRLQYVVIAGLGLAWLGCGVNLVRESHWSSLRWLDPFPRVMSELRGGDMPPPGDWVMTHPAARYYFALGWAREQSDGWRVAPGVWRRYGMPPTAPTSAPDVPATPRVMLERLADAQPKRVLTVETAGFSDHAARQTLLTSLEARYELAEARRYLRDPAAAWKDRLDPAFEHPEHRIVVRVWQRRE